MFAFMATHFCTCTMRDTQREIEWKEKWRKVNGEKEEAAV